jgi:hypothetical protein
MDTQCAEVEVLREEDWVGLALDDVPFDAKSHRLTQLDHQSLLDAAHTAAAAAAAAATNTTTASAARPAASASHGGARLVRRCGRGGGGEDGLQEVGGQFPADGSKVERVTVAEWPIELRAQRVEHHVHLPYRVRERG